MALFLFVWVKFNGGFVPSFFVGVTQRPLSGTDADLLDHFQQTHYDGSMITWLHGVNSRKAMQQVLKGDYMMIEGDILLRGQNTDNQHLEAIMAHPPDVASDLTFNEWLKFALKTGRGLKLDFKSIEAVELSLQKLREAKDKLHVPVHLSAELLEGPNWHLAPNKPLDHQRFFRLCHEIFPRSTIALGWTNGWTADKDNDKYDWSMVKTMHDLIEHRSLKMGITLNIRAVFAKQSATALKWLMEMTGASLTLFSPSTDDVPVADLLYIRQKFPKHKVFYDLDAKLTAEFAAKKHITSEQKEFVFEAEKWKVVHYQTGEKVYLGNEAVVMQHGMLVSKDELLAQPGHSVEISGRIEFLEVPTEPPTPEKPGLGLEVCLRVTQASRPDSISGICCYIGANGDLHVRSRSVPGVDVSRDAVIRGTAPCFQFTITDASPLGDITLKVARFKSCSAVLASTKIEDEATIQFTMKNIELDGTHLALRSRHFEGFTVIDQLRVKTIQQQ